MGFRLLLRGGMGRGQFWRRAFSDAPIVEAQWRRRARASTHAPTVASLPRPFPPASAVRLANTDDESDSTHERHGINAAPALTRRIRKNGGGGCERVAQSQVQQDATGEAVAAFGQGDSRVTLVLPSGSGKTVVGLRVAEALAANGEGRSVLVLLPTLDLVAQTAREWLDWTGWRKDEWAAMAVCSRTITGLSRSTDPAKIAAFLQGGDAADYADTGGRERALDATEGVRVLFCTYHSWERVAEAQRLLLPRSLSFDLCICDEAHVTAGRAAKRFAGPLDEGRLEVRRRLFLTATPRLYATRQSRAANDAGGDVPLVASMDDEALYGPVAYRLKRAEAQRLGIVVPLKVVTLEVDEAYERLVRERPVLAKAVAQLEAEGLGDAGSVRRAVELAVALLECNERYGVRSAFSFHSTNASAALFQVGWVEPV